MRKLLAITFLVLLGCGEKGPESIKIIDFDGVSKVSADLMIEKAILLGTDSIELLGEDLRVQHDENGFFIMNYMKGMGIHHFSPSGEHLGLIAQVGEAPGQIPRISDFKLSNDSLLVISGMGDRINLHSFSMNHELVETKEILLNVFSFQPIDSNELWFYSGYNMVAGDHRLFKTDWNGNLEKKLLPNEFNEKIIPIDEQSFFHGFNRTLFREPFKTSIFEISSTDSLIEVMRFEFGDYTVPEKFWEMDPFEGFDMINKSGFTDIYFFSETERYYFADVISQKERVYKKELFIKDKSSSKQFKIEVNKEELGHFYSPFGVEEDYILFVAYAPYLIQNMESLNMTAEVEIQLAELKEESNPVILYAKIPE